MDLKKIPVTPLEVIRAGSVIAGHLRPSPLRRYESLSRMIGAEVFVKHENHNPTGTFKIRGRDQRDAQSKGQQGQRGDYFFHGQSWYGHGRGRASLWAGSGGRGSGKQQSGQDPGDQGGRGRTGRGRGHVRGGPV